MATCHNEHSLEFHYSHHLVDLIFIFVLISKPFGFYFVLRNRKRRCIDWSGWWSISCRRRQLWRQQYRDDERGCRSIRECHIFGSYQVKLRIAVHSLSSLNRTLALFLSHRCPCVPRSMAWFDVLLSPYVFHSTTLIPHPLRMLGNSRTISEAENVSNQLSCPAPPMYSACSSGPLPP